MVKKKTKEKRKKKNVSFLTTEFVQEVTLDVPEEETLRKRRNKESHKKDKEYIKENKGRGIKNRKIL